MFEYERRGQLLGFSVRVQGELQGYAIYLLTTTLHCATTVHAISDVIFVAKPYRNGFMPVKFIKYCEDKLREAGAKVIYNYIKPGTAEHIFERMGQKQHEVLYVKVL